MWLELWGVCGLSMGCVWVEHGVCVGGAWGECGWSLG